MDCSGKWALVTGAASGIGQACSAELQARGATVVATDLASLDVTKEADWVRTLSDMPRLDILVHSAGISFAAPLPDMALDDWRRVLSVNLDGAFLAVKHALRVMIPKRSGSIILISSA
ncbi:MAG: SDR family NAD(P)-dependent oxidoreductase, partial [Bryobacterales bacterium]|nr:SDR family NAD(P)-dependent oxidoreductase [Bryobacterales bacterium]